MGYSLWIIVALLAALVLYGILIFNSLVRGRNHAVEAWSDIETHLKRRYDLIPNLVETVKGYAAHERSTLEMVIGARNAAMNQSGGAEHCTETENALGQTLKSIFALAEAYPDLKASQNFVELQQDIADAEDKIQASRRFYNSVVMTYNTRTATFPSMLVAGLFKFKAMAYFELDEAEKAEAYKPVKVQF